MSCTIMATQQTGLRLRMTGCLRLRMAGQCLRRDFLTRAPIWWKTDRTGEVGLFDREGNVYVTVTFDAPMFAVWSPEGKDAPFVCIEPWYGRCDAVISREVSRSAL